jgi:hypothetical protein
MYNFIAVFAVLIFLFVCCGWLYSELPQRKFKKPRRTR